MTYITGTSAADSLTGIGGDTVEGGLGNDTISGGGSGNGVVDPMTVFYKPGDGDDTLVSTPVLGGKLNQFIGYAGYYDLHFGPVISVTDLVMQPSSIGFKNASGSISGGAIHSIFFADGLVLDADGVQILRDFGVIAPGPNHFLDMGAASTSSAPHSVDLGGGNDTVWGTQQADTIQGGMGNDVLRGNDGDDVLNGYLGDDLLVGGKGDDYIYAIYGADTVMVAQGDTGASGDLISVSGSERTVVHLGAGLLKSGMALGLAPVDLPYLQRNGSDGSHFQLSFNGGADKIRIDATQIQVSSTSVIQFENGEEVLVSTLKEQARSFVVPGLDLTGTSKANMLTGTSGNDTLQGLAGNDTLSGGVGDDRLIGGKGSDTYMVAMNGGHDTITENESALFATDVIRFINSDSNQLWFKRVGNDLNIAQIGTTDDVTVQGWFSSSNARVEKIFAADGKTLTSGKVQSLVNAMASFAPPPLGTMSLPASTPASITKVVASSWA